MIHTLFIVIWTFLVTVFFAIAAILASLFGSGGNAPHIVARIWARSLLFASRIRVTVKGLSNIDPKRSFIYMSNHQSNFDIPVLLAYLPVQFRWIAKNELFKIPIFGYAMKRAGYISIDRSGRKSTLQSIRNAAEIIRNGVSVIIFPEGTRSQDGNLKSFKNGGFVLAVDSGVPIIPIIIHGTWQIMSKNQLRIKPGRVLLEIQKPVESSNFSRKTKNDLLEKVRQIISDGLEEERKNTSC
ncbi:MAG TPA: lysophospholipid acyltransferase family protein [Desulfobacterales bacterium]|nr:lysophospholipid acyltransferase family protein [Desulfobacterales bacterium]